MRVAGLLLVLVAIGSGCWYRTPRERARERASRLSPTESVSDSGAAATCVVRVRVYAESSYARTHPGWQEHVAGTLYDASAMAAPQTGCRFTLTATRSWSYTGGDDLEADLGAIVRHDPGSDVDLVVGLISALPTATNDLSALGRARYLGRHAVFRAMDSAAEQDAIERDFKQLPEGERRSLYLARRAHKEASMLLHEWGHTLCAVHTSSRDDFLHPTYNNRMHAFSPANNRVIRAATAPAADAKERLERLLAALEETGPDDVRYREDREAQIDRVRSRLGLGAVEPTPRAKVEPASVRLVRETPRGCQIHGLHRAKGGAGDVEAAVAQVESELRAAAANAGADTVVIETMAKPDGVAVDATLYLCAKPEP